MRRHQSLIFIPARRVLYYVSCIRRERRSRYAERGVFDLIPGPRYVVCICIRHDNELWFLISFGFLERETDVVHDEPRSFGTLEQMLVSARAVDITAVRTVRLSASVPSEVFQSGRRSSARRQLLQQQRTR
ncbi:unnamed protein product, partial [Ectocarpus sp. 6 AP-2014]